MILIEQMEILDFIKQNERHINKLKEDYIQFKKYKKDYDGKLNEKNYQDVQVIINNIVDTIIKEVDPTYNNKSGKANVYQSWILQTFAKQNKQGLQNFDENLQKYKNYLIRYITYLEEIKIDNTKNINTNGTKILDSQINKYGTVFDLLDQLNKYEQKHSKQINVSQYSNIPDKIFELIKTGEIILVQELEKYMIFIPLTEQQQRLVGKDTEWCTQYQQRNTLFYNYNKSPIFSVRSKNVYKDNYQFYFAPINDKNSQYKNNEDREEINTDKIKILNISDRLVDIFLNKFDDLFSKLKDSYTKFKNNGKNKKLDWSIIKRNIDNIYDVPEFIYNRLCSEKVLTTIPINTDIILQQIEYNIETLKFIPKNYINEEIQNIQILKSSAQIKYFPNPSEKIQLQQVTKNGTLIKYILNPSDKVQLQAIKNTIHSFEYILNPSEKIQMQQVNKIGRVIEYIKNPSENVQLQQVNNDGTQIEYISNPSENVQLQQVKQTKYQIIHITNPSELVQLQQVTDFGTQLEYIKNPSENVQLAQVHKNGIQIKYIINPSENVQLEQAKQNGIQIIYIKNPNVQLEQIKQNGQNIAYLSNPSENVQLEQVKQNGQCIVYLSNPSENVQLEQVKENGNQIEFISNPSKNVQLIQVKNHGRQIKYIVNPSDQIQLEQVKTDIRQIKYILNISKEIIIFTINQLIDRYPDTPVNYETETEISYIIQAIIKSNNFTIDMYNQINNNLFIKNKFAINIKHHNPELFKNIEIKKEQKIQLYKLLQI